MGVGPALTSVSRASSWRESADSVWARTSWSSRAIWLRPASSSARARSASAWASATWVWAAWVVAFNDSRRLMPIAAPATTAAAPLPGRPASCPAKGRATAMAAGPLSAIHTADGRSHAIVAPSAATPTNTNARGANGVSAPPATPIVASATGASRGRPR